MQIKRILTSQATPGMIVADDIYTFNNQMILARGSELTNRAITRLKFYSINDIRIELRDDEVIEDIIAEEIAKPEASEENRYGDFSQQIRLTPEYKQFHAKYETSISEFEGKLKGFISKDGTDVAPTELLNDAEDILTTRRNGIHLFHMLHCMRDYQDETYAHSISVSLICNAMGHWLGWSREDIANLTLAGLLHDIGKIFLPQDLLKKTEPLSDAEFALIKTHPRKGYEAIKNKDLDPRIKYAVLSHHERCDGSGYPANLRDNEINSFAKIVAIADTYDAMTSPRIYRGPLCPFKVVHLFQSEGLSQYDPHYLLTFLDGTIDAFLHTNVRLSDGQEGEIVMINRTDLSRPTVKVGDKFINLFNERNLFIESMK